MVTGRQAVWAGALVAVTVLSGCSVNVNKDSAGKDKDVSIHTPFGGMQVHNNKGGAGELGLPAYPGAVLTPDHDGDEKSVDLQMGFGPWQMHVQVANYTTSDPEGKVQDYYRKALGRYGAVLTCHGNDPVGTPVRTSDGLTCSDKNESKTVHVTDNPSLELKAGSERRQHIVAFKHKDEPGTHFSLIALTLPSKDNNNSESEE